MGLKKDHDVRGYNTDFSLYTITYSKYINETAALIAINETAIPNRRVTILLLTVNHLSNLLARIPIRIVAVP